MTSSDPTFPPRSSRRPSKSRLLRLWAILSAVYLLIAAVASAGPFRAAVEDARTAQTRPVPAQRIHQRGPVPDAPDGPFEIAAKAVGLELLVLFGPPLLLLWFGWDVWFALAGFAPALTGAAKQGVGASASNGRTPEELGTRDRP